MGGISSNYAIAFSSMALIFSIDILISKTFNINRLFDSLETLASESFSNLTKMLLHPFKSVINLTLPRK